MRPRFTISNAITRQLAEIERARGFLEAAQLSEKWTRQMSERALLLEAHHSTHIEGTRLTLDQAALLLDGQQAPDVDADDVRELLNYREAFHLVSDYLDSGSPITEGLIREIHRRLVTGVRGEQADPGQYRLAQNYVVNSVTGAVVYTPPPPGDVPEMMRELVAWLNAPGEVHPVLVSGIAQYQLVHIHPFLDGNGRSSRLLSTLCLYRAGYDFKRLFTLSEYYDRDRTAFYEAIRKVHEPEMDLTGWLEYFVTGLATQLNEVRERGRQSIRIDALVIDHKLNERQATALQLITELGEITIQEMEKRFPTLARRTLQRDLRGLIATGLVSAVGATNQLRYRLYRDLETSDTLAT